MKANHYALIMAGGVGSRFWPISRTPLPKQFLDVLGIGQTLLQATYERFLRLVPRENIYILTNERYSSLVKEQLQLTDDNQIIGEPVMRNTAPCIAYACYKLYVKDPAAVLVIAPSDHLIRYHNSFARDVEEALYKAESDDWLITLGIRPSRPETGYGYIQTGEYIDVNNFRNVIAFTEKPDQATAQRFVEDGRHYWNAGIFIWKAKTALAAIEQHEPTLHQLFAGGIPYYNTSDEPRFLADHYPQAKNISIDYAIMEKADNVWVLPVCFAWSDLGTWTSVQEQAEKDDHGNAIIHRNESTLLYETSGCVVNVPANKKVVIRGLQDFVVAEANDTLLIYPRVQEQEIKQVVADAASQFGAHYI